MATVNITINGRKIQAKAGQTVYEAAAEAKVEIPVLCHHPALPPEGACRVCLVEIEKQRTLQPACTFPVTEGMVVHTHSPKVMEARKFALELLILIASAVLFMLVIRFLRPNQRRIHTTF